MASTNTGKSPRLKEYYTYWERRIFDALVKVRVCVCVCVMGLKIIIANIVHRTVLIPASSVFCPDGDKQLAVL